MNQTIYSKNEWHKKQAIENFNATWDLIDQPNRTPLDDLNMIHAAHASRYHWGQIGTPLHFARGEWQLSRVYALVNMAESALYHAKNSLAYCQDHQIGDFDLAFAYEAIARAYKVSNNQEKMKEYKQLASTYAEQIEKQSDQDYVQSELNTI